MTDQAESKLQEIVRGALDLPRDVDVTRVRSKANSPSRSTSPIRST